MPVKVSVERGTRKLFSTEITDTSGNPQNPDAGTCFVRLEKVGEYRYDSPSQWYACVNVGGIGVMGADIWLVNSWTLGDWLARFRWEIGGVSDDDSFEWVLKRNDRPWRNRRGPEL